MKIKPGYKSSEFWFTLVSFIFSGLYLTGILQENEQKEELIQVVSHAVESVILIGGQVFILARYIRGRNEIKKIAENEKFVEVKQEETVTNERKRTNNTRSRKKQSTSKRISKQPKKNSPK